MVMLLSKAAYKRGIICKFNTVGNPGICCTLSSGTELGCQSRLGMLSVRGSDLLIEVFLDVQSPQVYGLISKNATALVVIGSSWTWNQK